MSTRLQVLVNDRELREIKKTAARHSKTVASFVRDALSKECRSESNGNPEKKLAVVRAGLLHNFPTADIDAMNAQIAKGYAK